MRLARHEARDQPALRLGDAGVPIPGCVPRVQVRAGQGQHRAALAAEHVEAVDDGAGTGAAASGRDPAAQTPQLWAGAVAGVHERPGGAAAEQRVGASLVAEHRLSQGDECLLRGVGRGVVRRPADGCGRVACRRLRPDPRMIGPARPPKTVLT